MRNWSVHVFSSSAELQQEAARAIVREVMGAVAARGRATLALSGGSTPKAVYELLAQEAAHTNLDWNTVHLFWGDERCVPPDAQESNYRMVREALLERIAIPQANIHRIEAERSPKEAAERYEQELQAFFALGPEQFPRFDLMLLGLGEDGHTASLFPETPILFEDKRLVAETFVPHLRTSRISMTFPTINHARTVMFLVAGAAKARILSNVLEGPFGVYPAQRVQPIDGTVLWLVDADAAAFLSPQTVQQHLVHTS
jgi:6-phosphogluconolactonase